MRRSTPVSAMVPQGAEIGHLHWGGGPANHPLRADSARVVHRNPLHDHTSPDDFEFAVEVDPRGHGP